MENETNKDENESRNDTAQGLETQIDRLTSSMEAVSSELETIKLNIQKRKSENTTLKILFYTGLIVLLLGFLYTNSTLQRAQMDSLQSSIHTLQTLMNREMMSVEKNVYQQIDRLENNAGLRAKTDLQERLDSLTLALSRLSPDNEITAGLIERVKKESLELGRAYTEHGQSMETGEGDLDRKDQDHIEKRVFGKE